MPKYEITFERTISYTMEISAKNNDEAEEKFCDALGKLTPQEIEGLISDEGEFDIQDCEKI